jgi:serine/threonine protein kinase
LVLTDSGESHNESTAPQYLVYPVNWAKVDTKYLAEDPCLIDFGESFEVLEPPEDLRVPGPYRSPELILDKVAGFGTDLWALGCTLFEIRTGRKLFSPFDDDDDSYLDAMVQVLGKLPEPWWSTTWQERRRMYRDEPDYRGRAVAAVEPSVTKDEQGAREPGVTITVHPSVAQDARSLLDMLAPGLLYMSDERPGEYHRDICQTEKGVFADLLGQLLEYDPKHRISAKEVLNHEWFTL